MQDAVFLHTQHFQQWEVTPPWNLITPSNYTLKNYDHKLLLQCDIYHHWIKFRILSGKNPPMELIVSCRPAVYNTTKKELLQRKFSETLPKSSKHIALPGDFTANLEHVWLLVKLSEFISTPCFLIGTCICLWRFKTTILQIQESVLKCHLLIL